MTATTILPRGVGAFLDQADWAGAQIEPLAGDASFRRYFRVRLGGATAMLMDAPPPREDPRPFIEAARWLDANGLRSPRILADDAARGLVLLEDFGDVRMRDYLDQWPDDAQDIYAAAIDTLVALQAAPAAPFAPYTIEDYLREARLFVEWYCTAQDIAVDAESFEAAWREVLTPLLARQDPPVAVLRDYHSENIMLLGGLQSLGLLDFQDALAGHRAYDLVSLLQDARREVPAELEATMFDRYLDASGLAAAGSIDQFLADYAVLGAQRNAKIVGIFVRLWRRDAKPRYLSLIPRVWALLERDLVHPALAPVADWFDANVPADLRSANGGWWPE